MFDDLSVVERNFERLDTIDKARDEAEDYHYFKQREVTTYKTWLLLKRASLRVPTNAAYARQRDWARDRLKKLRMSWVMGELRCPTRRPKRDASIRDQKGLLMLQVGLSAAKKWVHVRELREELGDAEWQAAEAAEREAGVQARAQAEAAMREPELVATVPQADQAPLGCRAGAAQREYCWWP